MQVMRQIGCDSKWRRVRSCTWCAFVPKLSVEVCNYDVEKDDKNKVKIGRIEPCSLCVLFMVTRYTTHLFSKMCDLASRFLTDLERRKWWEKIKWGFNHPVTQCVTNGHAVLIHEDVVVKRRTRSTYSLSNGSCYHAPTMPSHRHHMFCDINVTLTLLSWKEHEEEQWMWNKTILNDSRWQILRKHQSTSDKAG